MLFKECYYCPFNMYRLSNQYFTSNPPQYTNFSESQFRDLNEIQLENSEEDYYLEGVRAPQGEVNRIVGLLAARQASVFNELNSYGINRRTATYLFRLAIGYVIDNEQKYSENPAQKTNSILTDFENTYESVLQTFLASGLPKEID